jgi:hypothetical protein
MAEFQEQEVFKGAIQSQGFQVSKAPDTSAFLREQMALVDKNFARIEKAAIADLDNKVNEELNILKMLSPFSESAMNFAETMGKAYIDQQITEGHNKARGLGKVMNYGIDPKKEEALDNLVEESRNEQAQFSNAALDAHKQGATPEAVNYIKSLPAYQRIGATRAYLTNKGSLYKDYLARFVQRTDIDLPGPDGNTFTPQEINDDPVKMQIALGAASRMFMAEEVGIGGDFNPSDVAMKGLYESMDTVDSTYVSTVRQNKNINDSSDMVATATEIYRSNGDLNAYLSALNGSLDNKGNVRSRSDALDYMFEQMVAAYHAGDKSVVNHLDQQILDENGNPTGKTWRQRFSNRLEGPQGILARFESVDADERAKARQREADLLDQRRKNFEEASKQRAAEKRPFTEDEIQLMLEDAMNETGKTEAAFPWLKNYTTAEARDAKLEADELDELRRRRGYLIESDLRDKSSATYQKYISIVQEDEGIAKLPENYKTDANKLITSLTNTHYSIQIGDAPKTPAWENMARRARNQYDVYMHEEIRNGHPLAKAQQLALQRLQDGYAPKGDPRNNIFATEAEIPADKRYVQLLNSATGVIATPGFNNLDQAVFAGSEQEIEQLKKYSEGQAEIPKLYYDLARNQKHLTAWDIAAAQYRAAGLGELGKSAKQEQLDRLDPALQSVITYKPTLNSVRRATATSFNTSTSSLAEPDLKRAADIVSKYESAGSGYNAVNQIGTKGGRGVLGFSGDFRRMEQHGGRAITDHTVEELLKLGEEEPINNEEWIKKGKIHAVTRYQFIHTTLKGLIQRNKIPTNMKMTPALQDFLFLSLLKDSGPDAWIGPKDKATPEEKAFLRATTTRLRQNPQILEDLRNKVVGAAQ